MFLDGIPERTPYIMANISEILSWPDKLSPAICKDLKFVVLVFYEVIK